MVVEMINEFIAGRIDGKAASDWALDIVVSGVFEGLPDDLQEAIHALFDLHDGSAPWVPGREELLIHREVMRRRLNETNGSTT